MEEETTAAQVLTEADIDQIFNDHYAGNAQVMTPEYNRAQVFRDALKRHISGGN